jgi:hypothetical protein
MGLHFSDAIHYDARIYNIVRKNTMQTTLTSSAPQFSRAGIVWLKLSVVYLIVGIGMGIAMGASQNFTLRPVHAHVNLLGWTTMALAGLIYTVFPKAGESTLARVHFWLMNLALPVMMTGLGLVLFGRMEVVPAMVVGEIAAALGIAAFAANLFINLKG